MVYRRVVIPALAVFALACGGDRGTAPPTYENIAGTYTGALSGTSQGVLLQANFTITITESVGTLGGSYILAGTLSDGVTTLPVRGAGTLAGTIASGSNPRVNITAASGDCPNVRDSFSGAYGSANHLITLTGPVSVFGTGCRVVLTYPNTTIILQSGQAHYTVTVSTTGSGTGTVTSDPTGINCTSTGGTTSGTCTANYTSGTVVTLTATAATGSVFSGWSGSGINCSGTAPCAVTVDQARSVTATFGQQPFSLTVQGGGSGTGTVTSDPTGINCTSTGGTTSGTCTANYTSATAVTLTATPATGSVFSGWSGSGINCSGTAPCAVTVDQARSVTATFGQQPFSLTVQGGGSGTGTVTSAPTGINCLSTAGALSGTCTANYTSATVVTLTATPATGSVFSGWSGDCTGSATCMVNMTAARSVTATFLKMFTLAFGVHVSGGGSVTAAPPRLVCRAEQTPCTASYVDGTGVTLTATPDPGWLFGSWAGNIGNCSASECIVSMTTDRAAIATFGPRQWIQLAPTGAAPDGRSVHTEVYDGASNRAIVFGGLLQSSGTVGNDVWVLTGADGTGGTPAWNQQFPAGGGPAARQGHSAVYDPSSNRMIVFGGLAGDGFTAFSDVWVLTNANGLGGTSTWSQLTPMGSAPATRVGHTAVYDPNSNRMVIFGGLRGTSPFPVLNDVWVLTNANGTGGAASWIQLSAVGIPPAARVDQSAVYDPGSNRMMVFGGRDNSSVAFNDVWVLTSANGLGGTSSWVQPSPSGTPPVARSGHTATYDAGSNRMIVFGGGNFGAFNGAWALTNANGIGSLIEWAQLQSPDAPPAPRSGHTAAYSPVSNRMMLFGGFDGSIRRNDVWVLTQANRLP